MSLKEAKALTVIFISLHAILWSAFGFFSSINRGISALVFVFILCTGIGVIGAFSCYIFIKSKNAK